MRRALHVCMIALSVFIFAPWEEVGAVVGCPASPGSVAGVRRRTRRRTAVVVASSTTAAATTTTTTTAAPATTTAAAPATAAAIAIGTTVTALPSGCANVTVGGATYYNCGGTYYQPQYASTSVQYVVVEAPE